MVERISPRVLLRRTSSQRARTFTTASRQNLPNDTVKNRKVATTDIQHGNTRRAPYLHRSYQMILFSLFNRASRTLAPPQGPASRLRGLRDRLGLFRREFLPTDEELDAKYLGAA